jgi:iron complex transport system ATP-binding protein
VTLRLGQIRAGYRGRDVLGGIDLELAPGAVTALIGPNGSGKSTLLKAAAGLLPARGTVERAPDAVIGYLPQDVGARAVLTVLETALLGRVGTLGLRVAPSDLAAAAATLDLLGLAGLADRHLDELSGGQRQLAFIAQVLARRPSILLLDEPTSTLDLRNQVEVLEKVRALTATHRLATLVVLHDLNAAARFADRLVLLAHGLVRCAGAPETVLRPDLLAEVYGVAVFVQPGPDGKPTVTPFRSFAPMVTPPLLAPATSSFLPRLRGRVGRGKPGFSSEADEARGTSPAPASPRKRGENR